MSEQRDPSFKSETQFLSAWGDYHILEVIGRGGMATVVRALTPPQSGLPREVALKFIHRSLLRDPQAQLAFQEEGRLGMQLEHPSLGRTYGVESRDGRTALIMEYVDGPSLALLHQNQLKHPAQAQDQYVIAHLIAQLAEGLEALHHLRRADGDLNKTVHRDVTPQNIILNSQGQSKLVDFGIAFSQDRSFRTATGLVKGKLAYLAPEYLQGKPWDHRIDIWSVGVVLWELLSGRRLFRSESPSQTVGAVITSTIPTPTQWQRSSSSALSRITLRALERDPERRYASAGELSSDLHKVLAAEHPVTSQDVLQWAWRYSPSQRPLRAAAGDSFAVASNHSGADPTTQFDWTVGNN